MRKKCAAICQTIIAACQPRSYISPPLLVLATFIHKKYGSRELTVILTSHVLAESYNEVVMLINAQMRKFFSHAALCGGLAQFVFDNADVNIATATGHRTVHAMGGISSDDMSKLNVFHFSIR